MTVRECQEKMTWREFLMWAWLYEEKPFGELAQDFRFADLMIFHGNMNSEKKDRKELLFIGKKRSGEQQAKPNGIVARNAEEAGKMLAMLAGVKVE